MEKFAMDQQVAAIEVDDIQDVDLFADDLEDRFNAGSVSSASTSSSASCAPSCASCGCTFSSICTGDL
jgi:hypothetical protein